jgi:hypothetical protein
MTLGQSMLVLASLSILGILILNSNRTILETSDVQADSEFGITAVSLATSLVEESMGKMFDSVVADSTFTLLDSMQLTGAGHLGHSGTESYRGSVAGTSDFNDFDDFNGLFLVYKSPNPSDTAATPGSDYEFIVPGIRSKFFVRARVQYVQHTNLNGVSATPTWHKRILITVTRPQPNPTRADTLVFPAVMSFWN